MAATSIATAYVRLLPDASGIVNSLQGDLTGAASTAGKSAGAAIGKSVTNASRALLPVSAAATGLIGSAVAISTGFDATMSKVQAISGATAEEFETLRNTALEFGGKTKFSVSEVAEAMTYMGMAGWKSEQMVAGIPGILSLAAAAGEDLATVSDIVTDDLTAFGLGAEHSAHFADVLAAAATNSNTNVHMMGETFKYAAPLIGTTFRNASEDAEQSMRDAALATGLMANSGIKASQAGTSLKNILSNMISPASDKTADAMDELGISITDSTGKTKTFRQIMLDMRAAFSDVEMDTSKYELEVESLNNKLDQGLITEEEYSEAMETAAEHTLVSADAHKAALAAAVAGKYGLSGLLAIVNASDEDFNKLASAIDGASDSTGEFSGTADEMAAVMQNNLQGQLTELSSKLQLLAVSCTDTILPMLSQGVSWLQKGVDWLNSLDDGTKQAIMTVGGIVAVAAPVLGVVGKLISGVSGIVSVVKGVPGVIGAASGALGGIKGVIGGLFSLIAAHPVIAVITAIVAGVMWLWNTNEDFRNFVKKTWSEIVQLFKNAWENIKTAWSAVGEFFSGIWNKITSVFSNIKGWFVEKFTAAKNAIIDVFNWDWGQIGRNILDGIGNALANGAKWLWDKAKGVFTGIVDAATGLFKTGSPSKVFNDIGRFNMEGLALGITQNADEAISAMSDASNAVIAQGTSMKAPAANLQPQTGTENVADILNEWLPKLANMSVIMDTGATVGQLAMPMDSFLGTKRNSVKRELLEATA